MPEKEAIFKNLSRLPAILLGKFHDNCDIWEENEGGAHFKVTKDAISIPQGPIFYALSISGVKRAKEKVIRDFVKVLGCPSIRTTVPGCPHIAMLSWNAEAVDKQMKKV